MIFGIFPVFLSIFYKLTVPVFPLYDGSMKFL